MADQQSLLREAESIARKKPTPTSLRNNSTASPSDSGVILSVHPIDPFIHPEFAHGGSAWRHFDPARSEAALLPDVADDSVPYVLADNVLQHCPRLSVALTNWLRAVRPGGLVTISVPDGAARTRRDGERWTFALQEPSAAENQANLLELIQTVCHMATVERITRRELRRSVGIATAHRATETILDVVLRKRMRTLTPVQSNHSPEAKTLAKVAAGAIAARAPWHDMSEFRSILSSGVQRATVVDLSRLYLMYQWARRTLPVSGDCIEVGSYRGGTAKLVSELMLRHGTDAGIHVFDTFAGMPDDLAYDEIGLKNTFTETSLAQVQALLGNNPRVRLHPGLFPQSIPEALQGAQFRFAHIDVDTERSVRDCLEFIYSRMNPDGIIIIDDYGHPECPGATRAAEQFFAGKPQQIIQMPLVSSAVVLMGC
jgi:O-methyltransferase